MQWHGIYMLILTELMSISGRDGRTATVRDVSSVHQRKPVGSELANASQASSYLQSPEVGEQESASSSFIDKVESTCFLFQT